MMRNFYKKKLFASFCLLVLLILFISLNFYISLNSSGQNINTIFSPSIPSKNLILSTDIFPTEKSLYQTNRLDNQNTSNVFPWSILSLPISLIAVAISFVNLWKTHYSKFIPLVACGRLALFASQISAENEKWILVSFDLPMMITNRSNANPGQIIGLRLVLDFPNSKFKEWKEFFYPIFEIDPSKAESERKYRFNWLNEVSIGSWTPITILPKQSIYKHYLFETRWEKPFVQETVNCNLEMLVKGETEWNNLESWKGSLSKYEWCMLLGNYLGRNWTCISTPFAFRKAIMPKDVEEELTMDIKIQKIDFGPSSHLDIFD